MEDMTYKLPLDGEVDADLIEWINSMPRSKKAEVIRHALRFYKSHLREGEGFFVMPNQTSPKNEPAEAMPKKVGLKKPVADLGRMIKGVDSD